MDYSWHTIAKTNKVLFEKTNGLLVGLSTAVDAYVTATNQDTLILQHCVIQNQDIQLTLSEKENTYIFTDHYGLPRVLPPGAPA